MVQRLGRANNSRLWGVYRRAPGDESPLALKESELCAIIESRAEARLRLDFATADALLRDLRARGVDVNDRSMEWQAGYSPSASREASAAACNGESSSEGISPDALSPDAALALSGPPALASALGEALLTQWRGNGRRRGAAYTHGFHAYKALMEPLCVAQLLAVLPGSGVVADPFAGSGTTLIECMLAGREAVGSDLSPLAVGIAQHQSWRPSSSAALAEVRAAVAAVVKTMSSSADADESAERARAVVTEASSRTREVAGVLFFLLSCEESYVWPEWRKAKPLAWRYERAAERYLAAVEQLSAAVPELSPRATVFVADARAGPPVADDSVLDGILTSPPYPGVYTYLEIAPEPNDLMRHVATQQHPPTAAATAAAARASRVPEIGSRAEKVEVEADPTLGSFAERWQRDTEAWLEASAARLRPGGRIAILIGDDSGVNCLESITQAAAAVTLRARAAATAPPLGPGAAGCYELRVLASASITDRATRPWAKQSRRGRGYRREHTILLEKAEPL